MNANSMESNITYKQMEQMLWQVHEDGMISERTIYRKLDEYRDTIQKVQMLKVRLKKTTANNNQNNYNEFVNTFYKFA
jgi:IS4 transposase